MHGIKSLAALIAAAATSAAPAQDREVRAVQLISMIEPDMDQVVAIDSLGTLLLPTEVQSFRMHDPSRRWVKYQMVRGLEQTATLSEAPEPHFTTVPDRTAKLAIPPWMRSNQLQNSASSTYVPRCQIVSYRPTGFLKQDAERRRERYFALMNSVACENGIPAGLFDAMIIQESRYDPLALSSKRAFGLSQLMPGTAASLGIDRFDVGQNLRGGARYLRAHLDRFGRYDLALAAYNAGPGRIQRGRLPAIAETRSYVRRILGYWVRLSGIATDDNWKSSPKPFETNRQVSLLHFQSSF